MARAGCRPTRDTHSWLRLSDGQILHSHAPGQVELRFPTTPDEFIEDWRCGPAPASSAVLRRPGVAEDSPKPLSRVLDAPARPGGAIDGRSG
jgi:hypothetical protein